MEIVAHLKEVPLFAGLAQEDYEALAMAITDQEFSRGQIIFNEGDKGVGFYIVISGRVKIYKLSFDGKEQILHIFGPGEPFAEVAVFTGSSYPAHAEAIKKSRIFFLPKEAFVRLLTENPALPMNMLASMSMRLKKFTRMIEDLSLKEVPGRLAAHLLYLSDKHESPEFRLDMAKVQLASLLGTIPETLSRILSKMSNKGLIAIKGPEITILDREGVEDLAEGETRL